MTNASQRPALPPTATLDDLILRAEKPTRYVGCEFGAVKKDLTTARVRFALGFPDTYEVGMSNLGFRLLYHLLNDQSGGSSGPGPTSTPCCASAACHSSRSSRGPRSATSTWSA
jgi:hypothetical protein